MARKMRMNTEARKNLFCALMSADDYLDAFERLVKVDKAAAAAGTRERDTAFVILTCCLKEVRCCQTSSFFSVQWLFIFADKSDICLPNKLGLTTGLPRIP